MVIFATRYRRKIVGQIASEKNRLQEILEDGNIKLSSVVSDMSGATATRTKNTYLRSKYDSLVGRRGKQINYYLNQLKEQGFEILTLLVFATF